ncbi:MAG: DUF2500 domain-containing protein [Clostridia bacterium]|nr:DUF2500 domain-containing protein [Clostridia bacterium]
MEVFFVIFFLMFFAVFGLVFYNIISEISRKQKNRNSPRISVNAKVVAKRMQVHGGTHTANHHHHGYTKYFATFEFESGDRLELSVYDTDYGMLVEGDEGSLTFRGTEFLSFERKEVKF